MVYKKIYLFLFLICAVITNIVVNCQLTPITDPLVTLTIKDVPTNKYLDYPDSSSSSQCYYNLLFLVGDSATSAGPVSDKLIVTPSSVAVNLIRDQDVLKLFKLSGSVAQGSSDIVLVTANSNLSAEKVEYKYNFTCGLPDYSDVKIVLTRPDDIPWSTHSDGGYNILFTITGLKHDLRRASCNNGLYIPETGANFTQIYSWSRYQVQLNAFQPTWELGCAFGTYIKINVPNPFVDSNVVTVDQLVYYPSSPSTNVVTEFGFRQTPLITFQSNTKGFTYQFLQEDVLPEYSPVIPVPYRGSKGNMTFILNFISSPAHNGLISVGETLKYINGTGLGSLPLKVLIKPFTNYVMLSTPTAVPYNENAFGYFVTDYSEAYINGRHSFGVYLYNFDGMRFYKSFPYGFVSNGNNGTHFIFTHRVTLLKSLYSSGSTVGRFFLTPISGPTFLTQVTQNPMSNDKTPPEIYDYEFIQLVGNMYIFKVSIRDASGLDRFLGESIKSTVGEALVSGTKLDGQYEFIVDILSRMYFQLFDAVENQITYDIGDYIQLNPLTQLISPEYLMYENVNTISNITFLNNEVDVTNEPNYNTMYFKADGYLSNKSMYFQIMDIQDLTYLLDVKKTIWPIYWDFEIGMFACKFVIPRGYEPGVVLYRISIGGGDENHFVNNFFFSESSQLRIANTYVENSGPIFNLIEKVPNDNYQVGISQSVGWRLTITDNVYGFSKGYIKVVGSFDNSIYTFNFTFADRVTSVAGTPFEFIYEATVLVTSPGVSQDLVITNVYLENEGGKYSEFDLYKENPIPFLNPFINYLNDSLISKFTYTCDLPVIDPIAPTLDAFKAYINDETRSTGEMGGLNTIDVGSINRTISFKFNSTSASGFKSLQLPIVYIVSQRMEILECHSKFVSGTATVSNFECVIVLPIGFGYPDSLLFSVYGFINNAGLYSGFTTHDLGGASMDSFVHTYMTFKSPLITSNERVLSEGGSILLYGKTLDIVNQAEIQYFGTNTFVPINIVNKYSSAIILDGVLPTTRPYVIRLLTLDLTESNYHTVYPIRFGADPPTPSSSSDIPPTSSSSTTVAPTCSSNSDCGGSNQGNCINGHCVCNSPWVGLKCTSKVIIVPQPSINNTNPTIEIPVTDDLESVFYKSLISIVSLRELNFNGNEIKSFAFDKWIFTEINNQTSEYTTNITSSDSIGNSLTTNITVTLEWFKDETIIQFANSSFHMNPSTIKYTINIDKYLFSNSLNQLQLVISALFESSSKDHCSIEQFSDTDNSNYIKIQIDNHSLYGRFIKRAIIDKTIRTVSNVLLNSQLNEITTSNGGNDNGNTQSSIQSFIGITIPNYNNAITIDPDFSVLLDSNSISNDDENSLCNSKSKSLSSAQLAGIIIGSVAFAAVVAISITYSVLKKKKDRKFAIDVQNKMNQLNK